MSHVLIIDDEESICWGLRKVVESLGHTAESRASAESGIEYAESRTPDAVVLDVRLPGMDGLTAVDRFREICPAAPVIVITAFGDLETAVRAVRAGAFEYQVKPFAADAIRGAIRRALESASVAEAGGGAGRTSRSPAADMMVGETPVMREFFKQIALAAASEANVLLLGESGTGKELAARAIHRHSDRADAPFVAINAAALSPSLAESELFGHVAGAFTGADKPRDGLLKAADGGTLFLDEVADIPLPIQVKLLRALEEGEVLPVGADRPVQTRFRVITATHRDLQMLVRRSEFRQDLFFRLWAYEVRVPPLRQRLDDIGLIAGHFAESLGRGELRLSPDALDELRQRPWHGNVRELRNVIEHAAVVARGQVLLPEHLPPPAAPVEDEAGATNDSLDALLRRRAADLLDDGTHIGRVYETIIREVERPVFQEALERHRNEVAPAARALGIHRTTLAKRAPK